MASTTQTGARLNLLPGPAAHVWVLVDPRGVPILRTIAETRKRAGDAAEYTVAPSSIGRTGSIARAKRLRLRWLRRRGYRLVRCVVRPLVDPLTYEMTKGLL